MANLYKNLPDSPGVYLMKDGAGRILYVGKAGNLRRRVSSYFSRPMESRLEKLLSEVVKIDCEKTDTAIEALMLEAELIKKHEPPFNIKDKDGRSFLYVEITRDKFPRVMLARGRSIVYGKRYGPFTSASSIREALRIIRRVFPFNTHKAEKSGGENRRPCFDYEMNLCPGVCAGAISRPDYLKTVKNIQLFFEGKKSRILKNLEKEMAVAGRNLDFEKAARIRGQIFALRHIQDVALIQENRLEHPRESGMKSGDYRIEGYDISNISGASAVGSMAVFVDGKPDKNEYRKFKVRTVSGSNDVGMMKEILRRRFKNNWPLPDLILVDGGLGQVNAARQVLSEAGLKIPAVGIAKGPARNRNEFIGGVPAGVDLRVLIKVRDEAHRFGISYHKKLRSREFFGD